MLSENRQNISTKESLVFCILGGIFVYFIAAIPRILHYLRPLNPSGRISITMYVMPYPNIYPYLISFCLCTIVGVYFLKKLNIKIRLMHFSLLTLILSIGGGLFTGILEFICALYYNGDYDRLQTKLFENWVFDTGFVSWIAIFTIIFIPFTILFLITTHLMTKFYNLSKLK